MRLKDVNAFEEAIRIWSGPTEDPDSGTKGYDRIVDQAGVQYTWEWFLIDPDRPWADQVPPLVRDRIKADLDRRSQNSVARAEALAEEAEREAEDEDERMIELMNAKRQEEGRELLTDEQAAAIRDRRRRRRAHKS